MLVVRVLITAAGNVVLTIGIVVAIGVFGRDAFPARQVLALVRLVLKLVVGLAFEVMIAPCGRHSRRDAVPHVLRAQPLQEAGTPQHPPGLVEHPY